MQGIVHIFNLGIKYLVSLATSNNLLSNYLIYSHRALEVIHRIQAKLTGKDFANTEDSDELTVEQQVERLIIEATSDENLCQLFAGWCPMW